MHVKVKDGLAGAGAGVDDRAVAGLAVTSVIGHPRGDAQEMAEQCFVPLRGLVKRFHVFERNHQHMGGGLRIYVLDGNAAIILMDKVGRDLARDDFAEEAVGIRHALV